MLLVLCLDLDDDLGRKTGLETPVIGRDAVEAAAVALATADPEDSDSNVLFCGLNIYDEIVGSRTDERGQGRGVDSQTNRVEHGEEAVVAAVTGNDGSDVSATRAIGEEVDTVLATLQTDEEVRAILVTDGAQDESIIPVIRSRVTIDGVRRVVVRQAQNLESMYYTIKQVLNDPETRGTILVPLGILLLIYPLAIIASEIGLPGAVFGVTSALLGFYVLFRGLGLEERVDQVAERARMLLYAGRVTIITYVVAMALLIIGGVSGTATLESVRGTTLEPLTVIETGSALVYGAVRWLAAAGITTSLGQITDEYLAGRFEWRYLNAPFYVLSIAAVLHAVSGYFIGVATLSYLATTLTGGTLLGLISTLTFAVAEARYPQRPKPSG